MSNARAVIGIVAAVLRITGIITVTPVFLWVVFGIAVVYLGVAFVVSTSRITDYGNCLRSLLVALLVGALITILAAVILLAVTLGATSTVGAILTAVLLASFSLMLTSTACLALCSASTNDM